MVFHKVLTPSDGPKGIKATERRLTLTKVVLEQRNCAACLFVKTEREVNWSPFEFLDAEKRRTADMNLTIEKGETLFFQCKEEPYFGPNFKQGDALIGGRVVLHLYGNKEATDAEPVQPSSLKRARTDGNVANGSSVFP